MLSAAQTMTRSQIRELAASTGFPDPDLAAAVAMAESGGNVQAVGDPQFGNSIGLWQINLPSHPEFDAQRLFDATYNAQAAFSVSRQGTNWTPWTTFRTGAYQAFLPPPSRGVGKALLWAFGILGVSAAAAGWLIAAPDTPRRRAYARENPARGRPPMAVQSLLFQRDAGWTPTRAKRWARSHGYRSGDVDVTDAYIHLRQRPPEGLKVIRTKHFGDGISARVGR